MNLYHIWCDLAPGARDLEFVAAVDAWLGHLRAEGAIESWRLTRRKLGLGGDGLGEMHIIIETHDLAQLDQAFDIAATRSGPAERLHSEVYRRVRNARFALYRDFPGAERRVTGSE